MKMGMGRVVMPMQLGKGKSLFSLLDLVNLGGGGEIWAVSGEMGMKECPDVYICVLALS